MYNKIPLNAVGEFVADSVFVIVDGFILGRSVSLLLAMVSRGHQERRSSLERNKLTGPH
jgi:hypothetical protein